MTSPDPLIHALVAGRYRIVRPLGHGGMGQVYLAMHTAIEKEVALKVLKPEYSSKEDIVSRFQQEAISASRIKHPNVLEVFDFGKLDNGCAFLAMEYLAGNDLADELNALGNLDVRRAIRIALQVTRALSAAHRAGVVHRDLKPDNVFLQRTADNDEIVKIVDFGIAQLRNPDDAERGQPSRRRLTKTGMIFGTPEYMAPEQAAGKNADHRVDIYATGIILFEMLTGGVPFSGDSFMGVLNAHLHDPIPTVFDFRPDVEVSADLQAVISRCLQKDPDARFLSMSDVAAALLLTPEATFAPTLGDYPSGVSPHVPPAISSAPRPVQSTRSQFVNREASHAKTLAEQPLTTTPDPATLSSASGKRWLIPTVIGAAAVGGYFWVNMPRPAVPSVTNSHPEANIAAAAARTLAAPIVATPQAQPSEAPAPPSKVHVRVETTPPGAVLSKDGFQVCDATPCDLDLEPGEAAELEAVTGKYRGRAKVLAQKAQTVTIRLLAPKAAKPQMCEALSAEGLKILRPCP